MRIGKLNKRAQFQTETRISDGAGGFARTWSNFAKVWAKLIPKTGSEQIIGDQQTHVVSNELIIRYRTDITTSMRVVISGTAYNVQSFSDTESDKRYLTLSISQGVAI